MSHHGDRPVVVIVGTRPEGIKMIPVYFALKKANIPTLLCSTAQHNELLTQVFDLFDVVPDSDLAIMRPGQDLFYLTSSILEKTKEFFLTVNPLLVLVQGDTTSTMAAAMAAFFLRISVGHVEAGLRTYDLSSPFPEEMNRRYVGLIADYHFAPTQQAEQHLRAEMVAHHRIYRTGNTVVDALRLVREKLADGTLIPRADIQDRIRTARAQGKKIVLLTAHRRESFNGGIERILQTMKNFLQVHPDVVCCYPYHPNPSVLEAMAKADIAGIDNFYACEPLLYKDLVYILSNACVVATDSGGIQEEAVSLGIRTIVLREKTERMEGVDAGIAHLVGTDSIKIYEALENACAWQSRPNESTHVYGDGYAAQKIAAIIKREFYPEEFFVEKKSLGLKKRIE